MSAAVVTGGAGFVGSHVAELLQSEGYRVTVVDDLSSGHASNVPEGCDLVELDILDHERLQDVFRRARPELVCHLAAQASVTVSVRDPRHDLAVNARGTLNVCEAARDPGSPVVFASTGGALYGNAAPTPTEEDAVAEPLAPYGASKQAGEAIVGTWGRLHGLPHVVLRLGNVYGPRQNPHGEAGVVAIFSEALLGGRSPTVFGDGRQTRDYVHVHDVARAFLLAGRGGRASTYNVGTGLETSVLDLLAILHRAAGTDLEPAFEPLRPGELLRSALDSGRLRAATGWAPTVDLEEGIAATFRWYESVQV